MPLEDSDPEPKADVNYSDTLARGPIGGAGASGESQFLRQWAMNGSWVVRRGLIGTVAGLAALIVLAALLGAALDAGYFRGPLIRFLAARTGRQIRIEGPLKAHLFSLNPRLIAEHVAIGNPPWMPAGRTADIGKISLVIEIHWFGHSFSIERLEMEAATLHLMRDATGHANWQLTDPDKGVTAWPLIRSLSMSNAHVELDDALRHLQFDGTVSAEDANGADGVRPLRIAGDGQLNGRTATFDITGDPLDRVSHESPYGFAFAGRSSGSRLVGHGVLLRPFDFDAIDTTFEAAGADLKDLYLLTGVTLVNTGSYHLSGTLSRRGTKSKFSDLVVTSGQSDVRGHVSIESSSGRPKFDADFSSKFLRLSDLGAHAAGGDSELEAGPPLLLSNAMLSPSAVRRSDAVANFHALRVDVGPVSLHAVAAKMTIDHGVLIVAPLLADVLEGKLVAQLRLDATKGVPTADVDIKIADLQLGQLPHKGSGQPPFEGLLRARVTVTGQGRSVHQVAASATGIVTVVLPRGAIRASLAELTGTDLRGLGLLISKNTQETGVRCGVASFQAHQGTLTAQSLIVDTDPVLITGDGVVHLDSEALDLEFRGHPKGWRLLRLRSPVLVRGTLAQPSIDIQARHSVAQAAAAVTLGVVLTPLAAVLAFVDPGLARDADCAALLTAAKVGDTPVHAVASAH